MDENDAYAEQHEDDAPEEDTASGDLGDLLDAADEVAFWAARELPSQRGRPMPVARPHTKSLLEALEVYHAHRDAFERSGA